MSIETAHISRTLGDSTARPKDEAPILDVVIPVYNEEQDLDASVRKLRHYLRDHVPYSFRITIVDNASTDATADIADDLSRFPDVVAVHLDKKGRGRALAAAWSQSDAAVLAYMDVDLSTDLKALLPLIAPLVSGHSDVAIGSRLNKASRVVRGRKREYISRAYNLILRGTLAAKFSDAQCGFKAVRREVAEQLLPLVEDTGWFFDTELLVLAQRAGLRIHEVPVDWVDDPDSRVDIVPTAIADLKGIARLKGSLASGSLPMARLRRQPERQSHAPLFTLLAVAAVLFLWGLGKNGWANDYYAAAVQAGTQSWKALLFGSSDAGNIVTVDKPPASLWIMGLSARIFGLNSWSLLVPSALEGLASVALLYATVRRWAGPAAALLAGAIFALTPTAVVMFRFDNPDALLVLAIVAGGYCVTRALENGSGRWLALAGVAIGFAFLAKLMQGFLVVPGLTLAYLICAPVTLRKRVLHLLGAGAAIVVSAGWYVALVAIWPASSRPYIGGSVGNSLLELTIGYNGLGRIFGHEHPGGGGAPGGAAGDHGAPGGAPGGGRGFGGFGGKAGITRLFGGEFASQISWLLPAALILLVAGFWFTRKAPRIDRTRAALVLWGGWLLVSAATFSYMKGIIHEYYTIAMAPAIAVVIATSVRKVPRPVLALAAAATAVWGYVLLSRTPHWFPALRYVVLVAGLIAAFALLVPRHRLRRAGIVVTVGALLSAALAPAAYATDAMAEAHTGGSPTAGPTVPRHGGFPGFNQTRATGRPGAEGSPGAAGEPGAPGQPGGPGFGGFGRQQKVAAALVTLLKGSTGTTWAAATVSAMQSAPIQLAVGRPIMDIGGFSGGDPAPTLAKFQQYVSQGRVRYFLARPQRPGRGGGRGGPGGFGGFGQNGTGQQITTWVQKTFTSSQVAGQTVYDLTLHR